MRTLHILFIDSNPQAHNKIKQMLSDGFVVQCVESISAARAYLNTTLPDILISEVLIGQESGLDLCRYVRSMASLRHLPIMLLTSRATLQDKIAGFDAGTDDYVVKPFDARHLMARIRLLARIKHLEHRTTA